jgi:hypothetical protein
MDMPDDPPLDFEMLINELLNTDADLATIEERVLSLGAQLLTAAKSDPDILTSASEFLKAATSSLNQTVRVGGRVFRKEPVPPLPPDAATTIHQVKVGLRGAKPPTWHRLPALHGWQAHAAARGLDGSRGLQLLSGGIRRIRSRCAEPPPRRAREWQVAFGRFPPPVLRGSAAGGHRLRRDAADLRVPVNHQ